MNSITDPHFLFSHQNPKTQENKRPSSSSSNVCSQWELFHFLCIISTSFFSTTPIPHPKTPISLTKTPISCAKTHLLPFLSKIPSWTVQNPHKFPLFLHQFTSNAPRKSKHNALYLNTFTTHKTTLSLTLNSSPKTLHISSISSSPKSTSLTMATFFVLSVGILCITPLTNLNLF